MLLEQSVLVPDFGDEVLVFTHGHYSCFFFWLPENISGLARNHCTTNVSLLPVNCKHGDVTWFVSWASKLKMSLFRGSSHSVSTEWQCLESEGLLVFFLFFSKRY